MKTVLVTGATGFLGSHLTPALEKSGSRVIAWSRSLSKEPLPNVQYHSVDLSQREQVEQAWSATENVDAVVHLAARIPHGTDDEATFTEANILGLRNMLNACAEGKPHFIYASSIDVYGNSPTVPYLENQPPSPATFYGETKLAAENLVTDWALAHSSKATILRLSQVYGPGEAMVKVIPRFIDDIEHQRPLTLVAGGIDKRRYLAVEDAIAAFSLTLERGIPGIFNIAGEETVSIRDLITLFEGILGRTLPTEERDGIPTGDRYMSIGHAKAVLGFQPSIALEDGLRAYITKLHDL